MGKAEITHDDVLREKAIDVLKRTGGKNSDEIRNKMTNLSDQDRECITKFFNIDTVELESILMTFWLDMVKPVVEVFPGVSSEIFK